jgi:hypothetical protein
MLIRNFGFIPKIGKTPFGGREGWLTSLVTKSIVRAGFFEVMQIFGSGLFPWIVPCKQRVSLVNDPAFDPQLDRRKTNVNERHV